MIIINHNSAINIHEACEIASTKGFVGFVEGLNWLWLFVESCVFYLPFP